MGDYGKFFWNDASVVLMYTAENGVYEISPFDEEGYRFLDSLDLGDEIALLKDGNVFRMEVVKLVHENRTVQCQAKLL